MNRKFVLVVFAGLLLVTIVILPPPVQDFGRADFRAYWSAAYLLSQGQNFSDPALIDQVERDLTGWSKEHTVVTWNPPWLLVLLLPYAQFAFSRAAWLWLLTNISIITVAAVLVWQTLRRRNQNRVLALSIPLIAFTFSPALLSVAMGQINTLVLLGLAGFLYFHSKENPFYAGLFLSLVMVKPHLVYLTLPLIFLQALSERRWRLIAGFCTSLIALGLIAWGLRPSFFSEYFTHMRGSQLLYWQTPTLGGLVQMATGTIWVKFIGVALLPITIYLWWNRYRSTSTFTLVSALTIISIATAPFGWSYDFILLLIPILYMIFLAAERAVSRFGSVLIILALVAANALAFYQRVIIENELYFAWVPLFVGLLYSWTLTRTQISDKEAVPLMPVANDTGVR